MSEPQPGVTITLTDIYDLLLEVKGKVDPLPQQVADHEVRLRKLETKPEKSSPTAVWIGLGVSILMALITALGLIVTLIRVIPGVEV